MRAIALGTAGFVLYFLYDINSISWKNNVVQKFFAIGSLLVVGSTIWVLWENFDEIINHPLRGVLLGAGSAGFLALLVYTLFFALPFDETYRKESKERLAYTEGIYSICRHPGVLWFAGVYLCFWGMTGEFNLGRYFIAMILWNYLYIVVQDFWIFPLTFTNYAEYKKNTPFLLPNRKSMNAFLTWYAKRRKSKVDIV